MIFLFECFKSHFRWNGYNVDDYKKTVEEYVKLEMVCIGLLF